MATLFSLLNSTVSAGDAELDERLALELASLADGTYDLPIGSLEVVTTAPTVDTVTGKFTALSADLTATAWFTGTETASQELYALVGSLQRVGAYFAFDTDFQQLNSGPRTTVDCLFWDGDSVELTTFRAFDQASYVTGFTESQTTITWDSCRPRLEGLQLQTDAFAFAVI
jgi:hypothetical protein